MKLSIYSLLVVAFTILSSFSSNPTNKLIVIDAGHGGHDLGASHKNISEAALVHQIANMIKAENQDQSVEIKIIGSEDEFTSLKDRVSAINELNPDLLVSLHINNAENSDANGVEVFVHKKGDHIIESTVAAQKILEELSSTKLNPRGIKPANFMVLREVECPAVTLELGFISNENDRSYLTSSKGQKQIVKNFLKAI